MEDILRDTDRSNTAESSDTKRWNINFRRAVYANNTRRLTQEATDIIYWLQSRLS